MKDFSQIIIEPLITEKAVSGREYNRYYFKVAKDAGKNEIKKAVESLFNVKVKRVNTIQVKGKPIKRGGRKISRRSNWKKAGVTLFKGEKISLIEGLYS